MKQRISVRVFIEHAGSVLLFRRAVGRARIVGQYELPGGKVLEGEQPEDALRRHLHDDAGLEAQSVELVDAVTYTDHDARDVQYVVIVYRAMYTPAHHTIHLGSKYNKYSWNLLSNIQHISMTEVTQLLLESVSPKSKKEVIEIGILNKDVKKASFDGIVYSDGGSRGNPGPSAAGFVILDQHRAVVEQGGEYLGITTNGQAEYHGVRLGLEAAHSAGLRRIDFYIDSMMVVNQMNGLYAIKNRELWPIHERIRELIREFDVVRFSHVRREMNTLADGMVNRTLDHRLAAARSK